MAQTTISIERFRRRRATQGAVRPRGAGVGAGLQGASVDPLAGKLLGAIERRYGLMASSEVVSIHGELARSGDLAVADRLAFLAAVERHCTVLVVEHEGWYVAVTADRSIGAEMLVQLRTEASPVRIMSLVTERGITPALGPLCA